MNFEKIKKNIMNEQYAKEIVEWKYNGEYEVYNLPSYEECVEKKYGIINKEKSHNYTVYTLDDEVIFYSNVKPMEGNKLFIGVGMNPKYCGMGYGNYFLKDFIKNLKEKNNDKILFLEVRSWNIRAIKAYEKIGFKITNTTIQKDRLGNDTEFIEMELN